MVAALAGLIAQRVAAQCVVTTIAGGGAAGNAFGSIDGVGTTALFHYPYGIPVDATTGNVVVADQSNFKVRVISPNGTVLTLAGGGAAGNISGSAGNISGSADGVGSAALFSVSTGVAVDASGAVLVSDNINNKIRRIAPNGTVITLAGGGATGTASGSVDGIGTAALFFPTWHRSE